MCKYYNEQVKTKGNSNAQFHDQEEKSLNSTIIANSGAPTPKRRFNNNNVATIKIM